MIKIKGIIGNETGQYSLLKLITAVEKEPTDKPLHVIIDSQGGDLALAFDMYDYLRGLNQSITTESAGICASAASILFLAGDKRIAGCPIMIHNPWMYARGDSEQLKSAAQWIERLEKQTEQFYSKHTKLDSNTLSSLMKAETYMSPSEAVSLGFATSSRQIAQALITNNISNQNQKRMASKEKSGSVWERLQKVFAKTANMLDLTTASGDMLVVEREEGEPQVGDKASPDGSHLMPDGSTIVVTEGVISEIMPPEAENMEGEIDAQEVEQVVEELLDNIDELKEEIETKKEELAAAQALAKTKDEIAQLNAIKMAGGEEWLSKHCSTYKPSQRKANMRGKSEVEEKAPSRTALKLAEIKKARGIE